MKNYFYLMALFINKFIINVINPPIFFWCRDQLIVLKPFPIQQLYLFQYIYTLKDEVHPKRKVKYHDLLLKTMHSWVLYENLSRIRQFFNNSKILFFNLLHMLKKFVFQYFHRFLKFSLHGLQIKFSLFMKLSK